MNMRYLLVLLVASLGSATPADEPKSPERQAESLVDHFHRGDFFKAASGFDETMSKALPPDKLQQIWNQVLNSAGAMEKRLAVRTESVGQFTVCFVTCKFKKMTLDAKGRFRR